MQIIICIAYSTAGTVAFYWWKGVTLLIANKLNKRGHILCSSLRVNATIAAAASASATDTADGCWLVVSIQSTLLSVKQINERQQVQAKEV